MIGYEIESCTNDELLRFVRTLGQHRYVASRLHLVHAFAIEAAAFSSIELGARAAPKPWPIDPSLVEAAAWAKRALGSGAIELESKDERLYRRVSDAELNAVLKAFWGSASEGENTKEIVDARKTRLRERLASIGVVEDESSLPFDEAREDDVFPVLIDAGWELLPLRQLDWEKHRGAIQSFDDFEVARFEEENAIPVATTLHELPVLGAIELLAAFSSNENGGEQGEQGGEQRTRAPFVLWQEGNETYLDYVLRGVLRAAKITVPEEE